MPSLYRVVFSDDLAHSDPDGNTRGRVVPGEYQALLVKGQIVPLPHPEEDRTIREHGETFTSASLRGTYLRVTQRLCMQCGKLLEAPQISFGAPGCLPSVILAVAIGLYLLLSAQWPWLDVAQAAVSTLCGALLVTTLGGTTYSKLRWRGRQRSIEVDACPGCGSKILRSITSLAGQTAQLTEPARSVSVEVAGRS